MGSNLTRKITVNMYMTLDGYGEFPKYPGSDVRSEEPGEGFTEMWINRYESVDTILYGRKSYEGHLEVHSESARKASDRSTCSSSRASWIVVRRLSSLTS